MDEVLASSLISYRDDFFQETSAVESYYDNKPQKLSPGDLFLVCVHLLQTDPAHVLICCVQTADNTLKLRPTIKLEQVASSHPLYLEDSQRMLRRSGVAPSQKRDWAGEVSATVLKHMKDDAELCDFRNVLGRHASQYTAQLIERGAYAGSSMF